jgi:hypothetical protein
MYETEIELTKITNWLRFGRSHSYYQSKSFDSEWLHRLTRRLVAVHRFHAAVRSQRDPCVWDALHFSHGSQPQKMFWYLWVIASRPALGPTQPPILWVPRGLSLGVKCGRGVTLTTHPHLVPRLWISRTSSPPCAYMACSGTALLLLYLWIIPTSQNSSSRV